MTDATDSITRFAQHYRLEAAAVLVQIAKDENAPPQARQAAAEKILAYSDGRPATAKPVTSADVATMPIDDCLSLFQALWVRLDAAQPGWLRKMLDESYIHAAKQLGLPRPNRYSRGTPAPILPHHPQQPERRRHDSPHTLNGSEAPIAASALPAHARVVQSSADVAVDARYRSAPKTSGHARSISAMETPSSENSETDPRPPNGMRFINPILGDPDFAHDQPSTLQSDNGVMSI